jgi:hypothetical protein
LEPASLQLARPTCAPDCSNYWIGLKVKQRPDFGWMDPIAPPLDATAYQHWGQLNGVAVEPDNRETPPEDCAVANYTEAYGGAWGWADVNCERQFISLCKITSGWRRCGAGPSGASGRRGYKSACVPEHLRRCGSALPLAAPTATPAADGYTVSFTTSSNATFVLNTTAVTQPEAEETCVKNGGHLAGFRSYLEQEQVEAFLVDNVRGWAGGRVLAGPKRSALWRCGGNSSVVGCR